MNLIESALGYVGPWVIQKASALVGESPESTRKALETAVPAIVAGLAGEGSTPGGARSLSRTIEDAGLVGPAAAVTERLSASSGEGLIALGKSLLTRIFGGRTSAVTDAAAAASGVGRSSMASLLGLAGPLVLGALGSQIHEHGLDASGLARFLGAQQEAAEKSLPPSVFGAIAGPPAAAPSPPIQRTVPHPMRSGSQWAWPLLLIIPLALVLGLVLRRPGTRREWPTNRRLGVGLTQPAQPRTTPAQPQATVEPAAPRTRIGTEMEQFLAAPEGTNTSKRFVFDHLNFESATANLTQDSLPTLDSVAEVLNAYPDSTVLVEGHTDSTGDPTDNQRLSLERANAVKSALIERGVAADRIDTAGIGQDRPTDTNDTAEGRARNRRTELVVTKR